MSIYWRYYSVPTIYEYILALLFSTNYIWVYTGVIIQYQLYMSIYWRYYSVPTIYEYILALLFSTNYIWVYTGVIIQYQLYMSIYWRYYPVPTIYEYILALLFSTNLYMSIYWRFTLIINTKNIFNMRYNYNRNVMFCMILPLSESKNVPTHLTPPFFGFSEA